MDRLWTPWRLAYVTDAGSHDGPCIFCAAGASDDELVVHQGRRCYVILNKYPYNNGHLMVVPRRHVGWLSGLEPDERTLSRGFPGCQAGAGFGPPRVRRMLEQGAQGGGGAHHVPELLAREHQQQAGRARADGGGTRDVVDERDLPEEVAGGEPGHLLTVAAARGLTGDDEERLVGLVAFRSEDPPGGHLDLGAQPGDDLELPGVALREQRTRFANSSSDCDSGQRSSSCPCRISTAALARSQYSIGDRRW